MTHLVTADRCSRHAALQDLDTGVKKRNCFSSTNANRAERTPTLLVAGLSGSRRVVLGLSMTAIGSSSRSQMNTCRLNDRKTHSISEGVLGWVVSVDVGVDYRKAGQAEVGGIHQRPREADVRTHLGRRPFHLIYTALKTCRVTHIWFLLSFP